ncbi:MAG TPA: sugar ABC transporter permease [Clostridiales bacterium]|nr:sugar ABC transporter permease [Clostridiales bacterium]
MRKKASRIKNPPATVAFNWVGVILLTIMSVFCLLPFILLISGSLTSEEAIVRDGFSLIPHEFSTEAYKLLFRYPQTILRAYGVTVFITVMGTTLALLVISMAAYVLCRKSFRYRNQFSFFLYFTTLFNGGMVSTYVFFIRYLHLKDSLWALILPLMVNVFYLLIMRSFMSSIPETIFESCKIDGAGEFRIYFQFALPLVKSGLATVTLFIALDYWNDWYNAMLYMTSREKFPLQYMLYDMLASTEALSQLASSANVSMVDIPGQSLRMAMAVVATGPIILVYPFVQKYFEKGITIGSVKG